MILEKSNCYTQGQSTTGTQNYSGEEVQNILMQTMKAKGIDTKEIEMTDDGTIDIQKIPTLKLHSIMLDIEEQGFNIKYTKKTLIEIS